jgi:hypothetical protein
VKVDRCVSKEGVSERANDGESREYGDKASDQYHKYKVCWEDFYSLKIILLFLFNAVRSGE